jgi:hypothetical protein
VLTSWDDFNFHNIVKAIDIDGKEKDVVDIATSYVLSSIVQSKDSPELKQIKIKKRKEFPRLWAEAYKESFPVFLTYQANGYNGKSIQSFPIYGYPGYLSIIVNRNNEIRDLLTNSELNPNSCTLPDFLKIPEAGFKSAISADKFN